MQELQEYTKAKEIKLATTRYGYVKTSLFSRRIMTSSSLPEFTDSLINRDEKVDSISKTFTLF